MRLPSLVVIGGMKCGTTSLYQYLKALDNVSSSKLKEPSFFDDINWSRGVKWYKAQFRNDSTYKFEASTIYSKYPAHKNIPERMYKVLPEVKLVYLVRSPISRIRSQISHNVKTGSIHPSYLETEEFQAKDLQHYLNCSRYFLQLQQYLQFFPMDRIMIHRSEDLRTSPERVLLEILKFWGLDDVELPQSIFSAKYNTDESRGRCTNRRMHRIMHKLHNMGLVPNGHRLFEEEWTLPSYYSSAEFEEMCQAALKEDLMSFKELTGISWER